MLEQPYDFDEFVVNNSSFVGQTPYISSHLSIDISTLMVPPTQVAHESVLAADDQQRYQWFYKIKPPQFQGGKGEDAYAFLTLIHEMLEAVGLVSFWGVRFVDLQLGGVVQ